MQGKPAPPIMLVTDPAYADDTILRAVEACGQALPAGTFAVQLRDKKRAKVSLRTFASRLRLLTRSVNAWLIVNGDPELARDVGADGVHLGGDAVSVEEARKICGQSTFVSIAAHSDEAVRAGVHDGANAALVSAIFPSPGKAQGRGLDALRSARAIAPAEFAIYALGGVERANATACIRAGANGIAVIRAILLANDPGGEARAIYDAIMTADA